MQVPVAVHEVVVGCHSLALARGRLAAIVYSSASWAPLLLLLLAVVPPAQLPATALVGARTLRAQAVRQLRLARMSLARLTPALSLVRQHSSAYLPARR